MLRILFSIIFISIAFATANAQQRFQAGILGGLNVSQIRGDDTGGFNKIGLVGGLRVNTILTEKMDVTLELAYSQRGSRSDRNEQLNGVDVEIDLRYVEVPVLYNFKDWLDEEEDYYKVQASIGFAYARLINVDALGDTNEHASETENFAKDDFSFMIGAEYFIGPKFSISARWGTSINLLYNNQKNNPNINGLRGHFLTFRGNYFF